MELACENAYHEMTALLIEKQKLEAEIERMGEDKGVDHEKMRENTRETVQTFKALEQVVAGPTVDQPNSPQTDANNGQQTTQQTNTNNV
jgi:hypothetical protein